MKYFFLLITLLFKISNSVNAQIIEVITDLGGPDALVLKNNVLYIAEYDIGRISKIDVTDPNPVANEVVS